jgi:hypothetical protein
MLDGIGTQRIGDNIRVHSVVSLMSAFCMKAADGDNMGCSKRELR